ncbi:ParB/RepB/Spo0J family partition protein [Streptacidiphilus jiangxiensis]|uniref:Chromosome partitioning protein, ParB family n=1 Tax=Streptacidiphilus jiangxiensis TaxID=235985 RepID=A0A1H7JBS2_STRJI|nr:ParB/RepB/Spo0J family partition protein [Streptacidiphilus jiangxiensis]SEK72093.1 chromosome partitioning protein, ParB family [Streptacidiphilus jiangxiensis]
MSERRRGLGRGLGALIPAAASPVGSPGPAAPTVVNPERGIAAVKVAGLSGVGGAASIPVRTVETEPAAGLDLKPVEGAYFAELPVHTITPNPNQPRKVFDDEALAELVTSIKEVGLLQPIVVRQLGPERYELIMGERRLRASKEAGLDAIPAIVRATDDDKMLLDALLENLHRAQLNPLEEAAAYEQLMYDFSCSQGELADRIGRSRAHVSNTVRLLKLSPFMQRRLAAGEFSAGHARVLLAVDDDEQREALAARISPEGLSVRNLEEIATLLAKENGKPRKAPAPRAGRRVSPAFASLANRLSDRFDTRVKVEMGKDRGKIVVEFASVDDLDRILGSFAPGEGERLRQGILGEDVESEPIEE